LSPYKYNLLLGSVYIYICVYIYYYEYIQDICFKSREILKKYQRIWKYFIFTQFDVITFKLQYKIFGKKIIFLLVELSFLSNYL